ncbi:MAG TPA: trehalase family glycosidase [Candidatus Kryptonia bacterium]
MNFFRGSILSVIILVWAASDSKVAFGQTEVTDGYLRIDAGAGDPLFTTYAASMSRSRLYGDKAYFMDYFSSDEPVSYSSQYAGELSLLWRVNDIVIGHTGDFAVRPRVVASFPDMAILKYQPFANLEVTETFLVYSSSTVIIDVRVRNGGSVPFHVSVYPVLRHVYDSLLVSEFDSTNYGYRLSHYESLERLHSNLYPAAGYPTQFKDFLGLDSMPGSYGGYPGESIVDFTEHIRLSNENDTPVYGLNQRKSGYIKLAALEKDFDIAPEQFTEFRVIRVSEPASVADSIVSSDTRVGMNVDIKKMEVADEEIFKTVPKPAFMTADEKLIYLGALNLVRECMLPPEGKTKFNYYVFSRNPIWGWGHGHQVMHESLSMIPYSLMDSRSAEESQEIFVEQQQPDGLIPYRVGPRGPQYYPHNGVGTTSAPFFSWTNWEIYEVSHDKIFLSRVYDTGMKYLKYLEENRASNRDGLFEWGPYGMIENVRDDWNVVFQLFAKDHTDTVDVSNRIDCLDLSCQVANEIYYLGKMAEELGKNSDSKELSSKFQRLQDLINRFMWDPVDKFYYNVSMEDHSFEYRGRSLKRKEIIGFLPLWSRVATKERAAELVTALTNDSTFWRKYGVPTLSALDSGYTPFVDCCCHWNGPVWLLWDYMVLEGLENYGYHKTARELADKLLLAVGTQLRNNHRYWESYSPDYPIQSSPSNYIWDSIMATIILRYYSR